MSPSPLNGKHIVLGVSGSVAAYKAVDLASRLTQGGALVEAVLTEAAGRFVTPLSFQSVTGRAAYTDSDLWSGPAHVLHIGLARQADLLLVAPATAHTIAKLASGSGEDLLALTALACRCPLVLAPAMDGGMLDHPATQENLQVLLRRGAIILGPERGHLASGLTGIGRMTDPKEILGRVRFLLSRGGPLRGRKVVVTAGGTQEPLDPVRMITNRSSGKQGYALAQAALDAGAEVTLISAPVSLEAPAGATHLPARTANEMADAVLQACLEADLLLMAAAVADFRPAQVKDQKIKRGEGVPAFELERTRDILLELADQRRRTGHPQVTIGFAAETENLIQNARRKLQQKDLALIVANDVSSPDSGFATDTNRVTLISQDGREEVLPVLSKAEVAERILERALVLLA
ncbi:MAG: bifunctional phosphopantothenoylcysteine decarboxylase/phosphopantothenate--cysteine ligase CoaBC [Anaerolineales bacterium]|jgi:phosphopantothenoylcysteine decarboxylase/phosphopantothenate--cysteine ligase